MLLHREGWKVGKYLVERLYREEGLTLQQRRKRRRRVAEHRRERFHPTGPNQVWSMDFVADQLADGRRFRSLTVVDIYTREYLAIESEQRLKGEDVVLALNRIKIQRGVPKFVFCDNGSEFSSQAMDLWAYQNGVRMAFSRPGKPTDNAFVESFNGTFRSECLNAHWFTSLTEAQQIVETWRARQRESASQGSRGEDAERIRQAAEVQRGIRSGVFFVPTIDHGALRFSVRAPAIAKRGPSWRFVRPHLRIPE